jgi:hypothetical protein
MKNYYFELLPFEKKATEGYSGPDKVCAHFRSEHNPDTRPFDKDAAEVIAHYVKQTKRYWNGYLIGDLYVQEGREEVTASCPSYFEGHRSKLVYKKVN